MIDGRTNERPQKKAGRRRLLKVSVAALVCTAGYGLLVASRRVEVTQHTVPLAGLPVSLDNLRVLQISDLHLGPLFCTRSVRHVVELSKACHPDLIVLTGDFVNFHSMKSMVTGLEELATLRARFGVFACIGNHDYWEGVEDVKAALRNIGIPVLVNENQRVAPGLWIAAIDDLMSGQPDLSKTVAGIPKNEGVIFLSHNPAILPKVADHPWLVLSGHTHGGQLALPFLGPRGTVSLPGLKSFMYFYEWHGVHTRNGRLEAISGYRYPAGWYSEGAARMYVSRGVGLNQACPIRLNCPPEIACFTLQTAL